LLVQANAKNLGDGDLASAKTSFMFAILKEWFDADGNIRDDNIRYLYTCIEGVTEEILDRKVKEEEKEQKEVVWEVQGDEKDVESDCAMTLEKLMEVKGEESDLEDDVVVEQFKIFWKERREKEEGEEGE
jgi:hypothetical protein